MRTTDINLKITNKTNLEQNISILGVVPNPNSTNNINTLFTFDLSAQNFTGIISVDIVTALNSNLIYTNQTAPVSSQNIEGVVNALNTLNIGIFSFSGNIIYVSSNIYTYQNISFGLPFVSTWNTANTSIGSSPSNEIQLPLKNNGVYNFFVDWGDGTTDVITSHLQPESKHTYSSVGIYNITISGLLQGFAFETVGDLEKILSIQSFGDIIFGDYSFGVFSSCINLDLTSVVDTPNLSTMTSLRRFFDSYSFPSVNNLENWDISNIKFISAMFSVAINFNQNIGTWNTSSVLEMNSLFNGATAFNNGGSASIDDWDVSNVTDMVAVFNGASSFNQKISSWDVSNVNNMALMFAGATNFNQSIGFWNISNVNDFSNFMSSKTDLDYSSANLDSIYNNWSLLSVQPNIIINFGTIKYTAGASAGRLVLTSAPNIWNISDGGI